MSWDAMTRAVLEFDGPERERWRTDHGLTQSRWETYRWEQHGIHHFGVSWKNGYRTGFWDALAWVLAEQAKVDSLTAGEIDEERSKGAGSIFWPLIGEKK